MTTTTESRSVERLVWERDEARRYAHRLEREVDRLRAHLASIPNDRADGQIKNSEDGR